MTANGAILGQMMMDRYAAGASYLGDLWLSASQSYWRDQFNVDNYEDAPRTYLGTMHMFGDPSLRFAGAELPSQRDIAMFTSLSDATPYYVYRASPAAVPTASGDIVVLDESTQTQIEDGPSRVAVDVSGVRHLP
jgi:hypothetical protein